MNLELSSRGNAEKGISELWSAFVSARDDQQYYNSWLGLQSLFIGQVIQGLVIIDRDGQENYQPVAVWPAQGVTPERLSDVIEEVIEERSGLLVELNGSNNYALAYPLLIDGRLLGVVALETALGAESELKRAMEQLQWGVAWLELLARRRQNDEDQTILLRLRAAVDLLATTLREERFATAAMVFTTELAQSLGCERVSLGFMRRGHPKLLAVSHSAEVGQKMNLTKAIERAMGEAAVQQMVVRYPQSKDDMIICRDHEELSRLQSMASLMTVPLHNHGKSYGAVLCERAADMPFTAKDVEFVEAVAGLIGLALENKAANDRSLPHKIWLSFTAILQRLFGKGHLGFKAFAGASAAVILFLSLAVGNYQLSADTALEGAIQQAIVVPFDGYIVEAPSRAGDVVEEGQTLCSLDKRDLTLEKLAKSSRQRQMQRQYQEAIATHDRAQAAILKAQVEQLQAEIDLIENRLSRTRLIAPFAGLLVTGDLRQGG